MNEPDRLITENCHADDRKYQLNFSETTNDESSLIFPYWNHQRQTTLISGDSTDPRRSNNSLYLKPRQQEQ
jgi:hypothetical protein